MEAVRSSRYPAIDPLDIAALEGSLTGSMVLPDDAEYEATREIHNLLFDQRPAVIVQAADAGDVSRTVLFARDNGLELAVRSGGHSVAGHSSVNDGIVLDLRAMRGLHIDPEARVAWAQPGLTAGEYTEAAAAHGLATPFGDTGSVGIAGLTLGGGIGWLVRKHGLAIDSLLAVEIVTADGRLLTASADENADLFWAIRGGGGNFGVVTRFQYRLHPVELVLGGALFMPATRDVLRALVPVAASAPEELSTISFLMAAPPLPFIPAELHFTPVVAIMFVYAGDIAEGQQALEAFRAVATPVAEVVMPMPYPGIYQLTKDGEGHHPGVIRSLFSDVLDDEMVDTILEHMAAPSSPMAITQIRILGGAMSRVPVEATAFAHRERQVMVSIIVPFEGTDATPHAAWTEAYFEALRPKALGVYSNFLEDEGDARIREAYPAGSFERLAEVKHRYDPTNLFHKNQNIRPAAAPAIVR
jgi:FAD/FMN-containing dehydrogenase